MSISGNISGPGSGWEPGNLPGINSGNSEVQKTSPEGADVGGVAEESFAEGTSKSISKQEGVMRSSAGAEFLSTTELGMHKVNRALDAKLSSGKLKLTDSKCKSSQRAFEGSVKKSGRRRRSYSAPAILMKEDSESQGGTLLPAESVRYKKVKMVSPEVASFFLEGSGFSKNSIESDLSTAPASSVSFLETGASRNVNQLIQHFEALSKNSSLESIKNSWTYNPMMGGELSSLSISSPEDSAITSRLLGVEDLDLDKAVRTSSLIGVQLPVPMEASKTSYDSSLSFKQLNQETILRADESNNQQEAVRESEDLFVKIGKQEEEEELKKDTEKIYKELLLKSIPVGGFPLIGGKTVSVTWASGASNFRIPTRQEEVSSETITVSLKDKSGDQTSSDLSAPLVLSRISQENMNQSSSGASLSSIRGKDSSLSVSSFLSHSIDSLDTRTTGSNFEHRKESVFVLGSSFSFSSGLGLAVAPDEANKTEKKDLALVNRDQAGKGGPPNPLVYQYRNVSVDPPLILRNPIYTSSDNRLEIVGKPSIVEAKRDNQERRGDGHGKGKQENESEEKDDGNETKVTQ